MKVAETALPGVLLFEPEVFGDERGWFMETYRPERYAAHGVPAMSEQDNLSSSRRGVLRGLHLQHPGAQAKLCQVLSGEVFDVAVDLRQGSTHFGKWMGLSLSSESRTQLFIPEGFAHGFCVLSERALFSYKCSRAYALEHQIVVRWDDPEIGIRWPIEEPELSPRDRAAPLLSELPAGALPALPR